MSECLPADYIARDQNRFPEGESRHRRHQANFLRLNKVAQVWISHLLNNVVALAQNYVGFGCVGAEPSCRRVRYLSGCPRRQRATYLEMISELPNNFSRLEIRCSARKSKDECHSHIGIGEDLPDKN